MKKILLLDPAASSLNLGDEIIQDGVNDGIKDIIKGNFVVRLSSHLPISLMYERIIGKCDYKFVCGSNLLMGKINGFFKQWHISYKDIPFLRDSILVGAGWWQYNNKPNFYTKTLYRNILSKSFYHSVRDKYTEDMLKSIGIENVINTGCPSLWKLTPEHCKKIPIKKSDSVIFTLTDYNKNRKMDQLLIDILMNNYKNIFFWGQGIGDYKYLYSLNGFDKIMIINPTLSDYDDVLKQNDVDYVGTRLHGGIRAMQHCKRTIIVSIDNRANEMSKDFGINIIQRANIEELDIIINNDIITKIKLPWENIEKWKKQFTKIDHKAEL